MYHETDDAFYIGVGRTRSQRYLLISAGALCCRACVGACAAHACIGAVLPRMASRHP